MQKLKVVNQDELEAMSYEEICKYSDEIETNKTAEGILIKISNLVLFPEMGKKCK